MKFDWKIITVFLTSLVLTLSNPNLSFSKIPTVDIDNRKADNSTAGWLTHSNPDYSFKYPKGWVVDITRYFSAAGIPSGMVGTLQKKGNKNPDDRILFNIHQKSSPCIFLEGSDGARICTDSNNPEVVNVFLRVATSLEFNGKNGRSKPNHCSIIIDDSNSSYSNRGYLYNGDVNCNDLVNFNWLSQRTSNNPSQHPPNSPSQTQSRGSSHQGYCTFLPAAGFGGKIVNDRCLITQINNNTYQLRWSNGRQMSINLNPASIDGNSGQLIHKTATSATVKTYQGRVGFCWNCRP